MLASKEKSKPLGFQFMTKITLMFGAVVSSGFNTIRPPSHCDVDSLPLHQMGGSRSNDKHLNKFADVIRHMRNVTYLQLSYLYAILLSSVIIVFLLIKHSIIDLQSISKS